MDPVVQQFGYYAVSRLRQRLEMLYSSMHVPCPVALTRVRGVSTTSTSWKVEQSGNEKEAERSEGDHAEVQQGSLKMTRRRGYGKGRSARH